MVKYTVFLNMNWFEELPPNCPPIDAISVNDKIFYRLCNNTPIVTDDFISLRHEYPERKFANIAECLLRSITLWTTKNSCLDIKKFPVHKNKILGQITLIETDGVIKNTFGNTHYSWWRSNSFNPELTLVIEENE